MAGLTVITVHHRYIDGWYVFTSEDVFGLYVASKDPLKAIEDVIPSIKLLIEMNEGIKCEVTPAKRYREFLAAAKALMESQEAAETGETIPHPAVLESQDFVIRQSAA